MSWLFIYNLTQWLIRLTMLLVILRRRLTPATSLAWLSIIFFLPPAGLVLYLLVGSNRLGRRRVRLHRRVISDLQTGCRLDALKAHVFDPPTDPTQATVMMHAEHLGGMHILGGNHVELLGDHQAMMDRLIGDIDAAQHHVHLLYYIFVADDTGRRVAQALDRAVQRGVQCRLLGDGSGSRQLFSRHGLAHWLTQRGVQVHQALPVHLLRRRFERLDLRNHRKLTVIDGRIAYSGSHNIVDGDYGHRRAGKWIDLSARYTGPIVSQLQTVFVEDWMFDTQGNLDSPQIFPSLEPVGPIAAQAVPSGPSQESHTLIRVTVAAINAAKRRIIITSPYLVPDEPTVLALTMAVQRGVEVTLVIPQRGDHILVGAAGRAYYEPLLEQGVGIYLHRGGMLHAKTMTVDDSFAFLGSSNFDVRSFYLNFELNVLLYGPQITQRLRFAQTRYIEEAQPVDLDRWRSRPLWRRYTQSTAALLSPLL